MDLGQFEIEDNLSLHEELEHFVVMCMLSKRFIF